MQLNTEGTLAIPKDYPTISPESKLFKFPSLAYQPKPPTESEEIILTYLRPHLNDIDTMLLIMDGLFAYYYDELN